MTYFPAVQLGLPYLPAKQLRVTYLPALHLEVTYLPAKQSILDAIEHLFAKYLEMRPLFLVPALPMKDEWKIKPYLGVLPRVFKALKIDVTRNQIWVYKPEFDQIKQVLLAVTH